MEYKICTRCIIEKPLSDFYNSSVHKNGKNSVCSECMKLYSKNYRKEHLEIIKQNNKKYILEHPDKYNNPIYQKSYREKNRDRLRIVHLNWYLAKVYGMTLKQFNQMLELQNGVCAICGQPETVIDKRTNKIRRLSVDHNHTTGKIRALLCDACNNLLGQTKENINLCNQVINYLKIHNGE